MSYEHESKTKNVTATNNDKRKNLTQKLSLKYLAIELDDNLNFGEDIKNISSKMNNSQDCFTCSD